MDFPFMQVQVVYSQGLIRNFLVPREITVWSFVEQVRRFGKHRQVRFGSELDTPTAKLLEHNGATIVRMTP